MSGQQYILVCEDGVNGYRLSFPKSLLENASIFTRCRPAVKIYPNNSRQNSP